MRRAQVWLASECLHVLKGQDMPCGAIPEAVDSLLGLGPTRDALPRYAVPVPLAWLPKDADLS